MSDKKCCWKSCAISTLVTFVVLWGLEFLVHGLILANDYKEVAQLYRPQADMCHYMPYMILSFFIMAVAAVWVYDQGKKADKPFLIQGVRFGLAMACLTAVPSAFLYYCLQPIGCALALKQIALGIPEMVILGIVIAKLREKAGAVTTN